MSLPGCMMPDGAEPCEAYTEVREALVAMVDMFGKPQPEEYIDGGASYKLACEVVAKAKAALSQ